MADYTVYTDQELAALLKRGDAYAYTEICNHYEALVYIFTYNRHTIYRYANWLK
ncbi:hypothetical protein [Pedobacter africanus]|uniref:Uncharacterized protein n=1 Tax=Pedobacter africanus TaxID=151894 RepID=A0A1W1ZJ27_9SPHI|nr:hypothetical protein [Pedobacter africanus]SMC48519.1 hypothetical protein SAMN04488524_0777 [Pedobacter africanus]